MSDGTKTPSPARRRRDSDATESPPSPISISIDIPLNRHLPEPPPSTPSTIGLSLPSSPAIPMSPGAVPPAPRSPLPLSPLSPSLSLHSGPLTPLSRLSEYEAIFRKIKDGYWVSGGLIVIHSSRPAGLGWSVRSPNDHIQIINNDVSTQKLGGSDIDGEESPVQKRASSIYGNESKPEPEPTPSQTKIRLGNATAGTPSEHRLNPSLSSDELSGSIELGAMTTAGPNADLSGNDIVNDPAADIVSEIARSNTDAFNKNQHNTSEVKLSDPLGFSSSAALAAMLEAMTRDSREIRKRKDETPSREYPLSATFAHPDLPATELDGGVVSDFSGHKAVKTVAPTQSHEPGISDDSEAANTAKPRVDPVTDRTSASSSDVDHSAAPVPADSSLATQLYIAIERMHIEKPHSQPKAEPEAEAPVVANLSLNASTSVSPGFRFSDQTPSQWHQEPESHQYQEQLRQHLLAHGEESEYEPDRPDRRDRPDRLAGTAPMFGPAAPVQERRRNFERRNAVDGDANPLLALFVAGLVSVLGILALWRD